MLLPDMMLPDMMLPDTMLPDATVMMKHPHAARLTVYALSG